MFILKLQQNSGYIYTEEIYPILIVSYYFLGKQRLEKESKKKFATFNILIKAIYNYIKPDALTIEHTGYSKETFDH